MAEPWSWGKFFTGFIDGRNYAKAIVLGVCMVIMLSIGFCVYSVVRNKFPKPNERPDIITAETASVDKSTRTLTQTNLPFSHIFNFGSNGKTEGDKR